MKRLFLLIALLVVVLSACSGRDLSNVKTSLYGHWVDEESDTHYYFSDGKYIRIDEEGKEEKTYKIEDYDDVKNMLQIRDKDADGSGFIIEITYDDDKREFAEILIDTSTIEFGNKDIDPEVAELVEAVQEKFIEANTQMLEQHWKYVDDKQNP